MLNRRPIFLNCFSRGGSNILWNIFLTHPEVCSPLKETLEIFRISWRKGTTEGLSAALRTRQIRFFDQWNLKERRIPSQSALDLIDRTLFGWKLKTLDDSEMRFKTEHEVYTEPEVRAARLVAKNNNGIALLTPVFQRMYPDATFFALIRDPLALYESHKRRGLTKSPEDFARFLSAIANGMTEHSKSTPNYHLVRFEDVLADPSGSLRLLYEKAGLELSAISKVRFKAKDHLQPGGGFGSRFERGRHHWFAPGDVNGFISADINELQISKLDPAEASKVADLTRTWRERFGYA